MYKLQVLFMFLPYWFYYQTKTHTDWHSLLLQNKWKRNKQCCLQKAISVKANGNEKCIILSIHYCKLGQIAFLPTKLTELMYQTHTKSCKVQVPWNTAGVLHCLSVFHNFSYLKTSSWPECNVLQMCCWAQMHRAQSESEKETNCPHG